MSACWLDIHYLIYISVVVLINTRKFPNARTLIPKRERGRILFRTREHSNRNAREKFREREKIFPNTRERERERERERYYSRTRTRTRARARIQALTAMPITLSLFRFTLSLFRFTLSLFRFYPVETGIQPLFNFVLQ
jgi:hypothetical protein